MKAVMLSIQPKWCELIASGKKTVEVRKTAPYTEVKCYIYCTKKKFADGRSLYINEPQKRQKYGKFERWFDTSEELVINGGTAFGYKCFRANGRVIGEFVVNRVETFTVGSLRSDDLQKSACLSYEELINYFYKPNEIDGETIKIGYGWHISDLKIYDTPKELGEFRKPCPFPSEDCTDCPYMDWDYDAESDEEDPFCKKRLTRPPQSWCYVAELSE